MSAPADIREARSVPCGPCTACCRHELIVLHPESGDRAARYLTRRVVNPVTKLPVVALQQQANGDCIYLDDSGCTIHDRAPTICRSFDCRRFLAMLSPTLSSAELLTLLSRNPVIAAAARLKSSPPPEERAPAEAPAGALPPAQEETHRA